MAAAAMMPAPVTVRRLVIMGECSGFQAEALWFVVDNLHPPTQQFAAGEIRFDCSSRGIAFQA